MTCSHKTFFLLNQVVSSKEAAKDEKVKSKKSSEERPLGIGRQVLVALPNGGGGEVVEVNMFELLDNSVTFICSEKKSEPDS